MLQISLPDVSSTAKTLLLVSNSLKTREKNDT